MNSISDSDAPSHDFSVHRYLAPTADPEEARASQRPSAVSPRNFADYLGQIQVRENIKVYVEAAKKREQPMEHVILHGPPGLGKTTLARIIASELGSPMYETRGPAIERPGDLVGVLTGMKPRSVLFIDEIHRLSIRVEEVLYSAMEEFRLDIIVGQGAAARAVQMEIAPFTLIGATTRLSLLSKPLRERFGIQEKLSYYDSSALIKILQRTAEILDIKLDPEGARSIAECSRGTPRVANRLLRRVWDFVLASGNHIIDRQTAEAVLLRQGIDEGGLDRSDRLILRSIHDSYGGGPVGIDAIAATLNEDRATLEEVYEPYLVYSGLLARSPRGRVLTAKGLEHLQRTAGEISRGNLGEELFGD